MYTPWPVPTGARESKITMLSCGRATRLRECGASGDETQKTFDIALRRTTRATPRVARPRRGSERHVLVGVDDGLAMASRSCWCFPSPSSTGTRWIQISSKSPNLIACSGRCAPATLNVPPLVPFGGY